jgi:opacity protein-like surface antigen
MKTTTQATIALLPLALLFAPAAAFAQEDGGDGAASEPAVEAGLDSGSGGWRFGLAPRVGLDIPTSKLKPFVAAALEIDVFLPVLDNRLVLALDFSFTYPREEGGGTDPRVPGGTYDWEVKVLELKWALDVIWRFLDDTHALTPFVGLGPAVQYLRTAQTTSIDGAGENTERGAEFGFEILGGLDWRLGPGYLFGDVRFVLTDLDHRFTGDTNAGNVTICAGYRFVF